LIFSSVCVPNSLAHRALAAAPLAAAGRISYGLYLWHYPIFLALARDVGLSLGWTLALGAPLAFVAATASHRYVEQPALRLKRRFA
jgi:peptidoglycan/LPS O-acetylase OafA/YrhL